nr:hypothetical protein BaRGS_019357 [Batillaria attramentaria]
MQAARSPECNVQFLAVGDSGNRECSPLQRPVISTCNQTGLWSYYHQHVDYACANFTSVVFGKYKNVFCALCNGRYDYQRVKYDLLRFTISSNDVINMETYKRFAFSVGGWFSGRFTLQSGVTLPFVNCYNNNSLVVEVLMDIYSLYHHNKAALADDVIRTTHQLATHEGATVSVPAVSCLQRPEDHASSIHITCPTRDLSVSLGVRRVWSPQHDIGDTILSFPPLLNTSFCPYVNLTLTHFLNLTLTLRHRGYHADVVHDVLEDGEDIVHAVCLTDLQKATDQQSCSQQQTFSNHVTADGENGQFTDTWTAPGMTSLVCTCVSLVSLLLVMVTYIVLPALRAGTGRCTLAMSVCLFVAQAVHEFGIEQYEIRALCLVLAIVVHVTWLTAIFMMSACTVLLFLQLVFPIKTRTVMAERKVLAISLCVAVGLSLTVAGVTMAVNEARDGDLGYPARDLCFIKRSSSRWLFFGVPAATAILFNIAIFLFTVIYIRRRPRVRSSRPDRVSLTACFRLSVITGALWASVFLLSLPGMPHWLEYVAVTLMGLQATTYPLIPRSSAGSCASRA